MLTTGMLDAIDFVNLLLLQAQQTAKTCTFVHHETLPLFITGMERLYSCLK